MKVTTSRGQFEVKKLDTVDGREAYMIRQAEEGRCWHKVERVGTFWRCQCKAFEFCKEAVRSCKHLIALNVYKCTLFARKSAPAPEAAKWAADRAQMLIDIMDYSKPLTATEARKAKKYERAEQSA